MKDKKIVKIVKELINKDKSPNPQAAIAGKCGCSEQYIVKILSGKFVPGKALYMVIERLNSETL